MRTVRGHFMKREQRWSRRQDNDAHGYEWLALVFAIGFLFVVALVGRWYWEGM